MSGTYLLMIGEREALKWILAERRMAFGRHSAVQAAALDGGDLLFLVTTRGCFHNPSGDRTRVIGRAIVATKPYQLDAPITVAGNEYEVACELDIVGLAQFRDGLELAPLVPQMEVFEKKHAWSGTLRRTLLKLPQGDAALIERLLGDYTVSPDEALGRYL